jgi:structural maintenance of chromosome 2
MREELKSLADELARGEVRTAGIPHGTTDRAHSHSQVGHGEVEHRLQEERETLTRFDAELRDQDGAIKVKKQAVVDTDVLIKKFERNVQALAKEKAGYITGAINFENQHNWIAEESQW